MQNTIQALPLPEIDSRLARLRPLVRNGRDELCEIEAPTAGDTAYLADPQFTGAAQMTGMAIVASFWTLHPAKNSEAMRFQPTLAEVVSQLRLSDIPSGAMAFELRQESVRAVRDIPGFCGHRAQTVVYASRSR